MGKAIFSPQFLRPFVMFALLWGAAAMLTGVVCAAPPAQEPVATPDTAGAGGSAPAVDNAGRPGPRPQPQVAATEASSGDWSFITEDTPEPQPPAPPPQATAAGNKLGTLILQKYTDQTEQAFTILVPQGWQTRGGIVRVNPLAADGPANSIAAKLDFVVTKDDQNSVFLYFVPSILYCDPAKLVTTQLGFNQIGGTYRGMPLYPLLSAQDFLLQMLFPQIHPYATQVQVVEQRPLPELAQRYLQEMIASGIPNTAAYDAGFVVVTYQENGVAYKEKLLTVIHDYGEMGVGMWENLENVVVRAPLDEFEMWEPVLMMIQDSLHTSPLWWAMELQGQIQRGEIALQGQQDINRIAEEIVAHRRQTHAEIRNDMYLNMTNQEEYINPYSNEIDLGSNQYQRRWVNSNGDVLYTDDKEYDPNYDPNLRLFKDFKQCQVRPRGPAD